MHINKLQTTVLNVMKYNNNNKTVIYRTLAGAKFINNNNSNNNIYNNNYLNSHQNDVKFDRNFIRVYSTVGYATIGYSKEIQIQLKTKNIFGNIIRRSVHSKTMMQYENDQPNVVTLEESRRFMIDCFMASKTPKENAIAMADLLLSADYRGHFSHGMNRLEMYINDLLKNSMDGAVVPKILKETPATAWVDGQNGLGAVVGNFCIDLAIQKAKTVGVGWVTAKRSNHYGIAGWYSMRAEKQGLIGMSMTNTSPLMSPTRSKGAALGTNPISVAAPGNNGDSVVLDMATTAVAVGKIEMQRRKNQPMPEGWAQGPDGKGTTDPCLGFETGCLMPLGGSEVTSGYKGYGLGLMVELFCGVSAGARFGPKVRKWTHMGGDSEADLGQCFVAIDPNCFAPGFTDRVSELNGLLRGMESAHEGKPVLVAGDPERAHMAQVDKDGGVRYHENQIRTCHSLAERLKIQTIRFVDSS